MTEGERLQHANPVFGALDMMLYWASEKIDRETVNRWPIELSEVAYHWVDVSSEQAIWRLSHYCGEALTGEGPAQLIAIGQPFGELATRAIATLVKSLQGVSTQQSAAERINEWRQSEGAPALTISKRSIAQHTIGTMIVDQVLGIKKSFPLKRAQADHSRGYLALPLIGAGMSLYERACFGVLVIDALAIFHEQRLEPNEGFAPERMILTSHFELFTPRSQATQLKPLLSPEVMRAERHDSSSDVWSVARLSLSLFTGKPLATPADQLLSELPDDIAAPLKRALLFDRESRFFSGRELRVILTTPLEKWLNQLSYEARLPNESLEHRAEGEGGLENELIMPYEDYAEQQEKEREERVQKRRAEERLLRKKVRGKMRLRQLLGALIFSLLAFGVYTVYTWHRGELKREEDQATAEALARRVRFSSRDREWQDKLPQKLRDLGFEWRWLSTSTQGVLLSVTEVTKAQYQVCVEAQHCAPVKSREECVIDMESALELPMTCLSYYEADDFANFVGGRLPSLKEWRFAANIRTDHQFPWGEGPPQEGRANLFYERDGAEPKLVPPCQSPLGDSPHAICDLAGNVHEWVKRQAELSQNKPSQIGIIGGGWLTPPSEKFMRFRDLNATRRGEDLGFRVLWDIPTEQREGEREDEGSKP